MGNIVAGIIGHSLKLLVMSFISERVMLTVAYGLLDKLAKSTSNKIDDKVVDLVKDALAHKGYTL